MTHALRAAALSAAWAVLCPRSAARRPKGTSASPDELLTHRHEDDLGRRLDGAVADLLADLRRTADRREVVRRLMTSPLAYHYPDRDALRVRVEAELDRCQYATCDDFYAVGLRAVRRALDEAPPPR